MAERTALIIIPTYNERLNIELIIPRIRSVLPEAHILVVDDNSPDGTSQCVKDMQATVPNVFVLDRAAKQGLGKAYVSGFKWALQRDYGYIFEMDADFSHDPLYLPDFMRAVESADLVIGSRYLTGVNVVNWPMSRLLISYVGNLYARIASGIPVRDCTGGFKCFRREVLEAIRLDRISSSGYSFQIEVNYLAWKKGFRIKEIPIVFTDRSRGESKMSTGIIREGLLLMWRLRLASFLYRN
jgi:dolichol-phosphate mannosyltransferase